MLQHAAPNQGSGTVLPVLMLDCPPGTTIRETAGARSPRKVSPDGLAQGQFALGGADALKGYRFEEFRGSGIALAGTEYAFRLPWTFALDAVRLEVTRWDVLAFAEDGRIQDRWHQGVTPFLWSAGAGIRFTGRMLGGPRSIFRLYVAQAGEWRKRDPVFYALADIG